ncbi:AAA family ATPase [Conexibacter arvalis]|uniref:ATP/maltotriose-dependent transcriptional regulator MalT n=1 Tax=Conexibacter arvalis TaxID=912552 RepID=A0A840I9A3_9ACTN|nr:helix-turn-helix transcriptional regulator [Conexibacter arvalis]MBB4660714.1 ATP/maltotriose-dependent transcriptional regulator MalT [Conexibacter arvalis]
MLYGRSREREQLAELVRGAGAGRSFAVLVEGPAGIGKSVLLAEAVAQAPADASVLRTAGFEAEAGIPYGALSELLAPALHLLDGLPEAQRAALAGALALERALPRDRFAVPAAVLGLLGLAADERPLLVVVDDVHWLDPASREAVLFAAQRIDAEGVGIVLAARDSDGGPVAAPSVERLGLEPLARADALALLRDGAPLADDVAEALLRVSAGNPLALRELPRALSAAQRTGQAPLSGPPASGGRVEAAFERQLAQLPATTRAALCLLAAGAGSPPEAIERALAAVGADGDALAPARAAGLLVERDGGLAFRHPLLTAAAYHAAPSGERRTAHRALAAALGDVQHRAWQLSGAAFGPDEEAAAALRAAGEEARERGAHAEAARAFGRAAELSREPTARAALELEAARDHAVAGHGERALELARRAAESDDAAVRAGAEHLRAHVLMRGGDPLEAVGALRSLAARAAARGDRAASARYLLEASFAHMYRGEMAELSELAAQARAQAEGVSPELAMAAGVAEGEALIALGRSREGDALLSGAEPLLHEFDPLSDLAELVGMAAMASLWIERFERVERIAGRMIAIAREAGAVGRLPFPLGVRSQLHWRRGRWAAAYADAEEAVRLARETGQTGTLALTLAALTRAEAGIGRLEEARAHGEEGVALAEVAAGAATVLHSLAALGFAELTAGRAEAAAAVLARADAIDRGLPLGEPALTMYAPDLVEALVRAGRREEAARALARLEEGADRTAGAWSDAVAARGRLLLAEEADVERIGAEALLAHGLVEMPFERARTELLLGERLRRARRRAAARERLERALATFDRLGAEPWASRARTELRATGAAAGAPARAVTPVEELTPHELQVALLVAEGRTNREVGAALFLSAKTIEHHLSAIYRKLGLRSRTQLAAMLAGETG